MPDALVAEAVVTYADTAPIEVAEHLSPLRAGAQRGAAASTTATEPPGWLDALSTAPTVVGTDQIDAADIDPGDSLDATPEGQAAATSAFAPTSTDDGGLDDAGVRRRRRPEPLDVDDRSEPMVRRTPARRSRSSTLAADLADRDGDVGRRSGGVDLDSDGDDLDTDPAGLDDL